MSKILFVDRHTREVREEKVYGKFFIDLLYGRRSLFFLRPIFAKIALFSRLAGWFQKTGLSRMTIKKFIKSYAIDSSEFATAKFACFNDFFIRTLRAGVRPLAASPAILPADGRYRLYTAAADFRIK